MSSSNVPIRLLVDSGFWLALYDSTDPWHEQAAANGELVEDYPLLVPWPVLYETVKTRIVKRPAFASFERVLKRNSTWLLDDSPYREACLDDAFSSGGRPLSLVDLVLRRMLEDTALRIDGLLTINPKDFVDVCSRRRIEIVQM